VVITNIQFNQGPLGGRELAVRYGDDVKEYAVLQLTAGSPVTVRVSGWPDLEKVVLFTMPVLLLVSMVSMSSAMLLAISAAGFAVGVRIANGEI